MPDGGFDPFAVLGAVPASAQPPAAATAAVPATPAPAPVVAPPSAAPIPTPHGPAVSHFGKLSYDASGTPFIETATPAASAVPAPLTTGAPTPAAPASDEAIDVGGPTQVPKAPIDPFAALGATPVQQRAPAPASAAPPISPALAGLDPHIAAAIAADPTMRQLPATAEAMHSMTFGADQVVQPAIGATANAAMRFIQGQPQDWQNDYAGLQQQMRDMLAQFHAQHPIAAAATALAGGMASGNLVKPLFAEGAAAGAPMAEQALNYARNVGAGALAGFGSGFGMGEGGFENRLQSGVDAAKTGAALSAALPAVSAVAQPIASEISSLFGRLVSAPSKILSQGGQAQSVANTLARDTAGATVETSPVGPLDLAQATNNPVVAGKVDYAAGTPEGAPAAAAIRSAQAGAVRNQIGKIGAPATAADASAATTQAVRAARKIAGSEENRLWTVPDLAKEPVTPTPVQLSVRHVIADMDPEFAANMSPQLKGIVNRLNRAGPTTIKDLNVYRSQLESIARKTFDGAERAQARMLSDAFLKGMDEIPEIAGAPSVPTSRATLGKDAAGKTVATTVMSDAVKPNPALVKAYQTAREYTRTMRTMFANPAAASLLRKVEGVYRVDPSEGARAFFNFSNGSPEGPQSIVQIADFLDALKGQPQAGAVARELRESARSYIAAALSNASRLNEGQNFNPKLMQDFLRQNGPWIGSSGLFEPAQIKAADDLLGYVNMLRRPEMLKVQGNSATNRRGEQAHTFIDSIMHPWMRRLAELSATGTMVAHGGVEGGVAGAALGMAFEHAVVSAETAMRTLMANAVLDARVAADLLKGAKVNPATLAPRTKMLLTEMIAQIGAAQAGQLTGGDRSQTTHPKHIPQ